MVPLSKIPPGAKVRIARIVAGRRLQNRLASMGIFAGTVVQVISNLGQGPVIISRSGARYGLGWGMAQKVLVTHV